MRTAFTATRARAGDALTARVCECLAQLPQSHVPHIPNPAHIDDWQAQYREHPQVLSLDSGLIATLTQKNQKVFLFSFFYFIRLYPRLSLSLSLPPYIAHASTYTALST